MKADSQILRNRWISERTWSFCAQVALHEDALATVMTSHVALPCQTFLASIRRRMELRHLHYFVAVAQELHFRRAAERLHLAQPSLSRQIRDLEEEVGAQLFERDRKQVALTEAGRVLLGEAPRLLAGIAAVVEATRPAGHETQRTLHIGKVGVLSASFLPDTLAAFRKRCPQVAVEILELGMDEQVAALLAGTIQVGFQARARRNPRG